MEEREWVKSLVPLIQYELNKHNNNLVVNFDYKIPYANEVKKYDLDDKSTEIDTSKYETDLLIREIHKDYWKPRLIIEAKINSITTHDAITYSEKAFKHKNVHPYLRYGILLGNRKHNPLPGRLYRNGAHFDFMLSSKEFELSQKELNDLLKIIISEIKASKNLEEILYNSRKKNRKMFTVLHRPLVLK